MVPATSEVVTSQATATRWYPAPDAFGVSRYVPARFRLDPLRSANANTGWLRTKRHTPSAFTPILGQFEQCVLLFGRGFRAGVLHPLKRPDAVVQHLRNQGYVVTGQDQGYRWLKMESESGQSLVAVGSRRLLWASGSRPPRSTIETLQQAYDGHIPQYQSVLPELETALDTLRNTSGYMVREVPEVSRMGKFEKARAQGVGVTIGSGTGPAEFLLVVVFEPGATPPSTTMGFESVPDFSNVRAEVIQNRLLIHANVAPSKVGQVDPFP